MAFVSFPLFSGWLAPLVPDRVQDAVGAQMIKDTAAQSRFCRGAEGTAALERHLERQVDTTQPVLIETDRVGRTPHFTPVRLSGPQAPGTIVAATVSGHDGAVLEGTVHS